ncbi:hypothetical protein SASPL_105714 [Salvia splendens]|uniref:Uncharacterized protein n=1 Tax=Salvia splendens TaxID=180675 RepID=A0A8X8YP45_SALSN|nr:hypothetical protein SASPL_105714 [Salvia splendens]
MVATRNATKLDTSVDNLVEEFERGWKPQLDGYSKKLVEFCCSIALALMCGCGTIDETISDGLFSPLTFDMMLAWEMPSSSDEESHSESVGKEREERKAPSVINQLQDDVSLFYTDLMPLLVDREPSAGEDAFVLLGKHVPLVVDIVNGRFTYETLTAATANRLHFPAYDIFLKEIQKCIKHLQKQDTPTGMELADYEFILHVEGTASSDRVVRHIGGTSLPDAVKLNLSKDLQQSVKPTATGPWGAPLFDKAIVYESSELGDYILQELSDSLKATTGGNPCSGSSILMNLNVARSCTPCLEPNQIPSDSGMVEPENLSLLENAINQSREEAKEVDVAKASAEVLKEEGISESSLGLLTPCRSLITRGQQVLQWERPLITATLVFSSLILIYKEWVGPALSMLLLCMVSKMIQVRRRRIPQKNVKIVIYAGSDQSTMESIVSAQQGLRTVPETVKQINITMLKIWSILTSKAPKHTNTVMVAMTCCAVTLAVIQFKYILMAGVVYGAVVTSEIGRSMQNDQSNRRMREWWDSIPIIPVEFTENEAAAMI